MMNIDQTISKTSTDEESLRSGEVGEVILTGDEQTEIFDRFRKVLIGRFGPLGLYIYWKFIKNIGTKPHNIKKDIDCELVLTMAPILDCFNLLTNKMHGFIKDGLSLHDALKGVAGNINSREEKEIFDILKKEKIVEDGLNRMDLLKKKLTPAQEKKFFMVNPESQLEKFNFYYYLFTGSGARGTCKKKKGHQKKRGRIYK